MQINITDILDNVMLCTERLNAFNDIIEHDIADRLEGKGLNDVISILRAMTTASYREVKEIDTKLDELYNIATKIQFNKISESD